MGSASEKCSNDGYLCLDVGFSVILLSHTEMYTGIAFILVNTISGWNLTFKQYQVRKSGIAPKLLNPLFRFMQPPQNHLIHIKRPKRHNTSKQHFPGRGAEFPVLLDTNTERVKHKQQEQRAMDRPHDFGNFRMIEIIPHRHGDKNEDEQRNAFEQGDEAQAANFRIEKFFHGFILIGVLKRSEIGPFSEW